MILYYCPRCKYVCKGYIQAEIHISLNHFPGWW